MFISFEGPDGAGKTTQINDLFNHLTEKGYEVVLTREPGGTKLAEKIRSLLVNRDGGDWEPLSEVLLLYTARLEHIQKVIKPALKAGKIVISDRFSDSTVAYQGYGYNLDLNLIAKVEEVSINSFKPDLTIILDLDVKEGLKRTGARFEKDDDNSGNTEDRYEQMDISFHESLRKGFLEVAKKEPNRCVVVDASKDIETVKQAIREQVTKRLKRGPDVSP